VKAQSPNKRIERQARDKHHGQLVFRHAPAGVNSSHLGLKCGASAKQLTCQALNRQRIKA
jgi:hypothetical protein